MHIWKTYSHGANQCKVVYWCVLTRHFQGTYSVLVTGHLKSCLPITNGSGPTSYTTSNEMASLCNYTHPELQIADGLVHQETGILFPYNPEFYNNATGLYGPGALYCWYLLLASVLMHWFFCCVNNLTPNFSSDLLGALAYPLFAATDLLLQSVRMMGKDDRALAIYCLAFPDSPISGPHSFSDTPLDMKNIPPDVLDLGQRVIDIIGPYKISWTAGLFLYVLLFGLRKSGISSESKLASTRSPYLIMHAALFYIIVSVVVFCFSLADQGMAWTLFFWEGSRQAMLIGTWVFTALLIMVLFLSMTRLVQTLRKGRNAETREILHSILSGLLPGAAVLAVAFGLIMYFGTTVVPDVAMQLTERDQLATLMVGIVTWVYAMLDVCYCYFEPPNAAGEVVDKFP